MKNIVIIPSAGTGKRFGSEIPKQYLELGGIPVITRTLMQFNDIGEVESIVLPVNPGWKEFIQFNNEAYGVTKRCFFVTGGKERQDSVYNALISDFASDAGLILIHDAVRPFAGAGLIRDIIKYADEFGAAIPGVQLKDTIKIADSKGFVSETPGRSSLTAVQTPQGFQRNILLNAYNYAREHNFQGTDDASLVEFFGVAVRIIQGEETNIKITTKFDMDIAEKIILKLM